MAPHVYSPYSPRTPRQRAFSLVEMFVVIAIIGTVMAFLVPAFQATKSANDLAIAINAVAGVMTRARSYAMANNVYVYVGIAEVNADVLPSAAPQTPATATTGGRLVLAAVAIRDGTRGYDILSSLPNPAWTNYNNGSGLVLLDKLETYENIHLTDSVGNLSATGSMARPVVSSAYCIGNTACTSVTPFSLPLGSAATSGAGQYFFEKVIQFDPQGVARIQYATNQDTVAGWMEVGLQQSHGSDIASLSGGNTGAVAAVQIDGMTGAVRVFRP